MAQSRNLSIREVFEEVVKSSGLPPIFADKLYLIYDSMVRLLINSPGFFCDEICFPAHLHPKFPNNGLISNFRQLSEVIPILQANTPCILIDPVYLSCFNPILAANINFNLWVILEYYKTTVEPKI